MIENCNNSAEQLPSPIKVTKVTIFVAIVLTILHVPISTALVGGRQLILGELIGNAIGPIVFGLLVALLFQIFGKYRNSRSRWKIYSWTLAILLISNFVRLVQMVVPTANS